MEGVGARLGRSSTRYGGPTTVFSGPVRKWKKKWVNIPSPNSNNNSHSNSANGGANSNHSHLLLFKWTPISSSSSSSNGNNGSAPATPAVVGGKEVDASVADEAPRRKFRYVPVSAIEDKKQDVSVKIDDGDAKPSDTDSSVKIQNESVDGKAVANDILMEEAETFEKDPPATQDASESSLDLSLGLKSHEGKRETDPKAKGRNEGDAEMNTASSSESARKAKRKPPTPDLEMRV